MAASNFRSAIFTVLSAAFISSCNSQSYSDLDALGINCPARDKCGGYRNNLTYMDRGCECDRNCAKYNDCCIDAAVMRETRPPSPRTDVTCLHYGEDKHSGVYVISKCSNNWRGPAKVRERCLGEIDMSDPLLSAPATDITGKKTYRNLACAECNNADLASLTIFQLKLACEGLQELTEDEIFGDLTYSQESRLWGVDRLNRFGNGTKFVSCEIIFDVPDYLNDSVRFCRSNLISSCAAGWHRTTIKALCAQYMAAAYSSTDGYRNSHCAICNHKTLNEIACRNELFSRKRPMSFALLLDVNPSDGDQVGMKLVVTPECPTGYKYDPFFKKCRQLVCALPRHVVVNGRCVKE